MQEAVEARPTGQASTDYYDENGAFDSARCGKWLLHVRASAKSEEKMRFALDQAKRRGVPCPGRANVGLEMGAGGTRGRDRCWWGLST